MSEDFEVAFERARTRVDERTWRTMSTHDQAVAIYAEMRKLDLERAKGGHTVDDPHPAAHREMSPPDPPG